jgi:hypothetical protein
VGPARRRDGASPLMGQQPPISAGDSVNKQPPPNNALLRVILEWERLSLI